MIAINIEGLDAIRQEFARLVPEVQQRVLNGMAQVAFDTAQRQADTHTKTGALARSLRLRPEGDSAWIIDHNLQSAPHALFVHWGSRPHAIRPRTKKVLRWAGNNGFIFARFVRHPGYSGDPWLVKAADEAVRQFDSIVRRAQGTLP
jgi:hypothetical protein